MSGFQSAVADLIRADLSKRRPLPDRVANPSIEDIAAGRGTPLHVAVARFDGIGDWVLTLPLILSLLGSDAVASVTCVAPSRHASLLGAHPGVAVEGIGRLTILEPPAPGGVLGKLIATSAIGQRRASRVGLEARGRWDVVVLPRWDTDVGQNARAWAQGTAAPIIGFDPAARPDVRPQEGRERALVSAPVPETRDCINEIEHTRALMLAMGLEDHVRPGYGKAYFGVDDDSFRDGIAMHVSSIEPKRRWPAHLWREVASELIRQGEKVILIGGPGDAPVHQFIQDGLGSAITSTSGVVGLADLPHVLAKSRAFVGNDSGPMHIASSLGVPTVAVSPHPVGASDSHRNSPTRFGPWGTTAVVLRPQPAGTGCTDGCVASKPHCIATISARDVLAAVNEVKGA